jgi:uncharacterized protein (TIGR04255 family)
MKKKKLKNAPLKEAIFEILWELPLDSTGFPTDLDFELAQGLFADKIKEDFPVHKKTIPEGFTPLRMYPKLIHQFWKKEITWPVVQLGHGIMTVNDTDVNYIWDDNFLPNIEKALGILIESYKNYPRFNRIGLKYIDSIDLPDNETNLTNYLSKNFQTDLVNRFPVPGKLHGLNINQVFELPDKTMMQINIQTAINHATNKPAIVWITSVEKKGLFKKEDIINWVKSAHDQVSETFVNMLDKEFYENFDR